MNDKLKSIQKKTSNDSVVCEINDGIGFFIFNNPPSNLMDEAWSTQAQSVIDVLGEWAKEKKIRGVIVTSNGRHFSAGANLQSLEDAVVGRQENYLSSMLENSIYFEKLYDLPVPVVAAVRGVCIGSGFEFALACHYRICDTRAVMGSVEATFGIMPGCGATIRLPKIVGVGNALELIMSGRRIDAEEGYKMGIVDKVVHHKNLLAESIDFVNKLYPFYESVSNNMERA